MDRLIEGYRRFREGRWAEQHALYERLAERQRPEVLVIACSDSRVDPSVIFDAHPGELFIVRNVANLVPTFAESQGFFGTAAAIEFAVTRLEVRTILVLGHARCGGIAAALDQRLTERTYFLGAWIGLLAAARARIGEGAEDAATCLERRSIEVSLERLRDYPFVAEAMRTRDLALEGARFGIADGRLEILDPESAIFRPVP